MYYKCSIDTGITCGWQSFNKKNEKKRAKALLVQKIIVPLHSQFGKCIDIKYVLRLQSKTFGPFVYRLGREIFIL